MLNMLIHLKHDYKPSYIHILKGWNMGRENKLYTYN